MRRVMVRYQIHPDHVSTNRRLVAAVFEELAQHRPAGLRYASYQLADGVTFVHVAEISTADGTNPLAALESFQAFTKDLPARCEVGAVTAVLDPVGVYP